MQLILDNINAVMVGGVVLLIMAAMSLNTSEVQIDGARYYAGRLHSSELTQILERDIRNIGMGVDTSQAKIISYEWTKTNRVFEFRSVADTTHTAPTRQVKYELVPSKVLITDTDSVQCYQLNRYTMHSGSYMIDGQSLDTITDLNIQLLESDGSAVGSDLKETRFVDVSLAAISPLGEDAAVRRFRWHTRFRPINLTIEAE